MSPAEFKNALACVDVLERVGAAGGVAVHTLRAALESALKEAESWEAIVSAAARSEWNVDAVVTPPQGEAAGWGVTVNDSQCFEGADRGEALAKAAEYCRTSWQWIGERDRW